MLCAHNLPAVASGAEEPDVLGLVAAAHRPRDDVVVLDELVRSAGQTSLFVPLGHETLDIFRNRFGQTRIEPPFEALLIIALQHHQKRRDILGSAVT